MDRRFQKRHDDTDKTRRNVAILDSIRKLGPISKADLSSLTKINIMTLSNYIHDYIKAGFIKEAGLDVSEGGRRPVLVDMIDDSAYAIGVGVNIAHIVGVITDLRGKTIYTTKVDRPIMPGQIVVDKMVEVAKSIIEQSKIDKNKILGIGVGMPGMIDRENYTVKWPGGLLDREMDILISIKDIFSKEFDYPLVIENDSDSCLFAEKWLTLNPNIKNMIYMYSGVGCGLMFNGEIYNGTCGYAGEYGPFNVGSSNPLTWVQEAAQKGFWQIDMGLVNAVRNGFQENKSSKVFEGITEENLKEVTYDKVVEAFKAQDTFVTSLISEVVKELGRRIGFFMTLLNPEMVMVGGGLEALGFRFFDMLRDNVKSWVAEDVYNCTKIIPAELGEMAVALGAASLVVKESFMYV